MGKTFVHTISVVVPTYNRADLIGLTIQSILAQTRPADEIIIVDDGSTDDTAGALKVFGNKVKVIHIQNSGELVARNTGFRATRNQLVAFCDSDDLWMPDFLAVMSAQWQVRPDLEACYANFNTLSTDGSLSQSSKFDGAPGGYWAGATHETEVARFFDASRVAALIQYQPFFPSCMMVDRQSFLEQGGWDESVSRLVGCDLATALRVVNRPPVGAVKQSLVCIRKHANNFSADTEKMNLGDAKVLDTVLSARPELAGLEGKIRESAARRRRAALDSAFSRRDFGAVRQINSMLPPGKQGLKCSLKVAIANLPRPLGLAAATLVER